MEGILCQAPGIRPFKFGMYRQVARWATHSMGTPTQSTQLHSHQMDNIVSGSGDKTIQVLDALAAEDQIGDDVQDINIFPIKLSSSRTCITASSESFH